MEILVACAMPFLVALAAIAAVILANTKFLGGGRR